jgi:hypothetical protein
MPTAPSASVDSPVELWPSYAQVCRAERHVLADRWHEELIVGILEHDADAPAISW